MLQTAPKPESLAVEARRAPALATLRRRVTEERSRGTEERGAEERGTEEQRNRGKNNKNCSVWYCSSLFSTPVQQKLFNRNPRSWPRIRAESR